jgi:hypothetical protein
MNRFAIIPYDLYEDLANGEITLSMFEAMILLHKWADWETGTVRKVRAGRLSTAMGDHGPAARTFQRALKNLHDSGRIYSHHVPGSRSWYKIDINNYTALSGALKDTVLRPTELKDWKVSDSVEGAEQVGEDALEEYPEDGCEEATVLKSSQQSIQTSSSQSEKESTISLTNSAISNLSELPAIVPVPYDQRSSRSVEESGSAYGEEWFKDLQGEADLDGSLVRETARIVSEDLLGQKYLPFHEKTILPLFAELFSNGTPAQTLYHKIRFFREWVVTKGLGPKFTSVKDFFYHWNNESGRENGFRQQFEADWRAASPDEVSLKEAKKFMKQLRRDERKVPPADDDEKISVKDITIAVLDEDPI